MVYIYHTILNYKYTWNDVCIVYVCNVYTQYDNIAYIILKDRLLGFSVVFETIYIILTHLCMS